MVDAVAPGGLGASKATARPVRWVRMVLASVAVIAVLAIGGVLGSVFVGASAPEGGVVDVGFAQDMSVHHRQAVLMADLARERSTNPEIRLLAYDIETNQLQQIGQMQGWLSLWNASALPAGRFMTWMSEMSMPGMDGMAHAGGSGTAGVTTMPGMASPADLDQLRSAGGTQFDVLFLQLMLRHHQGGLPMARYAERHGKTAQVRNLAEKMAISQSAETETMTQMLAQRGAQPLPPMR